MHSTLNKWLEELYLETSIVVSSEINEEADGNLVTFGFNQDLLESWGNDTLVDFIATCSEVYRTKSNGTAMVFYAWFDEQAGQIRISSVSQLHKKLPFRCKLNHTDLSQVVNGIYAEDSGIYTKGALDVWCQNI
jgi:hypothetical protein